MNKKFALIQINDGNEIFHDVINLTLDNEEISNLFTENEDFEIIAESNDFDELFDKMLKLQLKSLPI
jgi:hypothetical protein